MQAVCAGDAARKDDKVPHLVSGAALADARLAVSPLTASGHFRRSRHVPSWSGVIQQAEVRSAVRFRHRANSGSVALIAPEPRHARRGAQSPSFCALQLLAFSALRSLTSPASA